MNPRVLIKTKAADRILAPLRQDLIKLFAPESRILEVGCGSGDLLFRAADKISFGYGVDMDEPIIEYAESRRLQESIDNLAFECVDALSMRRREFTIATSTLCLHEVPANFACQLIELMLEQAPTVVIADYTRARHWMSRVGIEVDELFSGHFRNYRRYRKQGEIPAYAGHVDAVVQQTTASSIDGIAIWQLARV